MLELCKRRRDVALISIVNNIIDLVDNDSKKKRVVKRGREQEWINDREETGAYSNIVLDLCLHDEEGFLRYMRILCVSVMSNLLN